MCHRPHEVTEFEARARCLGYIVSAVQGRSVERLVIESRQDDLDDERTIRRHRQRELRLVFEHRRGVDEQLLWIADGFAWAAGAGPRWREHLGDRLAGIVEA